MNLNLVWKTLIFCLLITPAYAQHTKELDSLFGALSKDGALNGTVLIAEDGKPIYEKAFGYADFATKRMLDNQTVFELASVSKQFTAMAIMQLHEKKKLSYDDDIKKYFPLIPYEGITIDDLLRHTSGIPDFLGWGKDEIDVNRVNGNEDILAALIRNNKPANHKPREKLSYSNTNYVLLALIVEKVSGIAFSEYLSENIFKPLNMTSTRVYPQRSVKEKITNYANGHAYDAKTGSFINSDSFSGNRFQYYFDGVAGPYGISSNIEDLLKWDQALNTEKLVSKEEQQLAYIPSKLNDGKTATLMGLPYGYGWLILRPTKTAGVRYMHSGGYPGYMTIIARYPEKNKVFILLTNTYNVHNFYDIGEALDAILFYKPFTIPREQQFRKSVVLSPQQLGAINGSYTPKAAPQMKFVISMENNQAYAQLTGQRKVEIYPESELEFFYTAVEARLKFEKDEKGNITKLTLFQNGQELEAVKE